MSVKNKILGLAIGISLASIAQAQTLHGTIKDCSAGYNGVVCDGGITHTLSCDSQSCMDERSCVFNRDNGSFVGGINGNCKYNPPAWYGVLVVSTLH